MSRAFWTGDLVTLERAWMDRFTDPYTLKSRPHRQVNLEHWYEMGDDRSIMIEGEHAEIHYPSPNVTEEPEPATDTKAGLTSDKPRLSLYPRGALIYGVRALEYGADVTYSRGNYRRPPPEGMTPAQRLLRYLDALMRHATLITDAMDREIGQGRDPAAMASLEDPESGLPHLAHLVAGLAIGIQAAIDDGLVPADPGQPWTSSVDDD